MSTPSPAPRRQYVEDFFVYTIDFEDLAFGTTQQASIQIQADSDFKWTAAAYNCNIDQAAYTTGDAPIPNVSLQLVDTGSGRQLFFSPVPIPSVFGNGQLPFILPIPRVFRARSSISMTVSNFDAAVGYNLSLAFIGTKVFTLGGQALS